MIKMVRAKTTLAYLEDLKNKGYNRYDELSEIHERWKEEPDVNKRLSALKDFLEITWNEKKNIKPTYMGENTYNNFRGIAFEEFCFHLLNKIIKESNAGNIVELFWNTKILTEEFYKFERKQFKKYPKYKAVDLVIGKQEDNLIHPLIIISCKIWQSTNWLDEDRSIFENIRNRYPDVLGYSLCMSLNVPPVSLISSQRTGLKAFNLSKEEELEKFTSEIKEFLKKVKENIELMHNCG